MTHLIRFNAEKSSVQLLISESLGYKILDESSVPKTYIHAPYLAIIKGAYLAIKNNIRVYKMEGWNAQISAKVDEWFGKSFPLKFKYPSKDIQFWIKSSQELMDKSFLTNGWELLEKAIIFIFGAIDRIYIDNPEAIKLEVTKLNYTFDMYDSSKPIESQFEEYNLFSDASVREFDKVSTIAGLIKNQKNEILTVYRRKVDYQTYSDSNLAEMLAITEGYLVATNIKDDVSLKLELERLSNSFGIGIIELILDEPEKTKILFPSKTKNKIDWDAVDKLVQENPDFKNFMNDVRIDVSNNKLHKENYDSVKSIDELKKLYQSFK